MIKRAPLGSDEVKVTFAVPSTVGKVSVIGDFNGWSPLATPMKPRSNGTQSVAVVLPAGHTSGSATSPRAAGSSTTTAATPEPNGYGETHSLLVT